MATQVHVGGTVHRTLKLEDAPAGIHARLAQVLVEHHRHAVAVYGFVRDSLAAPQPEDRQTEAVEHVRLLEICADWLELLEPKSEPPVRKVLNLYLDEVGKLAQVVRMQTPYLETDASRLDVSLDDVLRVLEAEAEALDAVDKRHSDTAV